jgi:hypothetical protein
MRVRLAGVAVVAVLAAGCGGGGGSSSSSDADSLVPRDALAFVTIDTDTSSGQVSSALKILKKFPIEPRAEQQLRSSISQGGVNVNTITKSAGPQVDVAVLNVDGKQVPVGFAKPSDEKAFDAQLDKNHAKHQTIDGWTVFADKQATIDAVSNRKGDLSDDAAYQAAIKSLPGDAIARFYGSSAGEDAVRNAAKQSVPSGSLSAFPQAKWFTGALTSQSGAFKLEVHTKSASTQALSKSNPLASKIPSGAIVALALNGGGAAKALPPATQEQLSVLGQQLGFDLPGLISVINGPVIAYVRPGIPFPEVTIAARPVDPASASSAIGGLLARFASGAKAVPKKVDGGTLNKLDLGPISLYYGVNDGQLVVTDSSNAVAELNGSVGRLSGDDVFKEAKDGAGMTDSAQTFIFLDVKDALPALSGFAQLANQNLPPEVENNLRPLRSALLFGSSDGAVGSFVVYVKTS